MLYYFLLFCLWVAFLWSGYLHFVSTPVFRNLVVYSGKQHVRMFEKEFEHVRADLWAIGHRKRRATRVQFGHDAFAIFRNSHYEHMMIVHDISHIPVFFDTDEVVLYRHLNRTVAELWPRLDPWPGRNPLQAYVQSGQRVETIFV